MTTPPPRTSRFLHRATQRVRAHDRRHPLTWDLTLTGFCVAAALIDYAGDGWKNIAHNTHVPGPLVLALSLALSVPLLWRRTHPMAALTVMVAAGTVNSATGAVLQAALLQLFVVFNLALRSRARTLLLGSALTTVPVVIGVIRYPKGSWDMQVVPQLWSLALVAALGIAVRSRQDYTASLVERARQLETERDQQARLAAAAERARIAREMHDIIGHNLSVITGLADGGSYAAARHPERAGQALTAIATTSRQALTDLRRLLDVLNTDADNDPDGAQLTAPGPDLTPQPALADLNALIAGVRTAGLPVDLTHEGTPALPLSPAAELALYRIAQEALTNTLKHGGPGATATVTLTHTPDTTTLTVTDTGRGGPPTPGHTGRGLTGMRERTALYDGTLDAGPRPDGGWRVQAQLPVQPATKEPAP